MGKIYAVAGSFAMKTGVQKGFTVFSYEEEPGELCRLGWYETEKNIGQRLVDQKKDCIYLTSEDRAWNGGSVMSVRIQEEDGSVRKLDEIHTCANQPAYFAMDPSGRYGIIPHHASDQYALETFRQHDGTFGARCHFDEAALVLLRLNEDGTFGKICDIVSENDPEGRKNSHLHSAVFSENGENVLVCDKGLDAVYVYRIDYKKETLHRIQSLRMEQGSNPRYIIRNQQAPVFYQNYERKAWVNVLAFDEGKETFVIKQTIPLLDDPRLADTFHEEGGADMVTDEEGKHLYVSVRSMDEIVAFDILDSGKLRKLQQISCGGKNPRGLCISPDGRFLFSQNRDSGTISRFKILPDGKIENTDQDTVCNLPGNMAFIRR